MCGICGIINFNREQVQEIQLLTMMHKMKHRGPDDDGSFIDNNVGLGFVRLSILDLSPAGHQPMFSNDKRYCIIFNGEIFNYIELRAELSSRYEFRTRTDTEVILAAYQEWGESCLEHFNGMWAFAIYDTIKRTVFISRDRFGIKPFYYYLDQDKFIFASDIPPILSVVNKSAEADDESIYDFLVFNRTNQTERTFFNGIKKLQHGHSIYVEHLTIHLKRWYDLSEKISVPFSDANEFRELLTSAVQLQLRSDVPVGACLSGGLDSSTIVSIILNYFHGSDLHSFSAVYDRGMVGDESPFIEEYRSTGSALKMHFTQPDINSLYYDLQVFVEALVEPVPGTSEYAEFKVMELAKKYCTVLLNGQGADEEMAGYLYFFGFYFKELLLHGRLFSLIKEVSCYWREHKSVKGISSFAFFLLPLKLKSNRFLLKKNYIANDFYNQFSENSASAIANKLYGSKTLNESLLNHFEYKFEHHLIWADRSGMWFSLETRFPFLDHRFVEKVLALTSEQILHKGVTKRILREAMQGLLPPKIQHRKDKVGYETPEDLWFRNPIFEKLIKDILYSSSFKNRGYFHADKVIQLYEKHLKNETNIGKEIWKWLHLELWFRKFID